MEPSRRNRAVGWSLKTILPVWHLTSLILLSLPAMAQTPSAPPLIDLTQASIVTVAAPKGVEAKAVQMLVEEVEKRTRVRWPVRQAAPKEGRPTILVGLASALPQATEPGSDGTWNAPEGYLIRTNPNARPSQVTVVGAGARGLLFGIGRLLRNLRMERDRITLPADLRIASRPFSPLRGHQLGYRPKTNSYDGWDLPTWEQYIRDLIVFGANAVELIPPRSDDDADSPHFPMPPMPMMVAMSRLLDSYGLDVWVWYPAMDRDYSDPRTVTSALAEWGEVFRKLPRIDAVFVPGGDPGHTEPKVLMALLEKQAANLHRYHPKARLWVSPQGFTQEWMDQFLQILRSQQPTWLGGIVFGPQVRTPLPELRRLVPAQYSIRHYPDITHSLQCQFPVENWDGAYALTQGREGINPRPLAEARLCRYHQPFTIGSLTYSEGCNDDVNKTVWSALEWDPNADVTEVLREYSRYFIDSRLEEPFAQGLLALERNWNGPLEDNREVEQTLHRFQEMEKVATPQNKRNWRFQQALYRAYYDAYVALRLRHEREAEQQALAALSNAEQTGWQEALQRAEAALAPSGPAPDGEALRTRIHALAEALFQSIRMQLSVPLYQAISVDRGANLDTLHHPLNNRVWLTRQFAAIRDLPNEADRLKRIQEIVRWKDPGPGGFYDDLGDPRRRPHLLLEQSFDSDPGHMHSVRMGYNDESVGRIEWARYAETLYDTPLRMSYSGLDSNAQYRIRVVYGPGSPTIQIRLMAEGNVEVHPWLTKPVPNGPLEFDIPRSATATGRLTLSWTREPGKGGNGRGCQVCEVWLLKQ